MTDSFADVLQVPGTSQVSQVTPGDVLASYSPPPLIKGGTFGASLTLAAGTVVARNTSTKLWVAYVDGGAGTTDPAEGILLEAITTGAGESALGNILMKGTVKRNKLTGLDSGAIADLNGRIIDRSSEGSNAGDYFTF